LADQPGLTHATNYGATFATEDQFNGALELAIQAIGQLSNGLSLGYKGFFSDAEVIHFRP